MLDATIPGSGWVTTCGAAKNYKKIDILHEKISSVLISLHHEITTRFDRWRVVVGGVWGEEGWKRRRF